MAVLASSSDGHVRKRPYQTSISSYFNPLDPNRSTSPWLQRTTSSPLSPLLPEDTQASLLSVGMRVRKSVPEGYKTRKTISTAAFALPTSTALRSSSPNQTSRRRERTGELMPFCGLHKTGGWAAQGVPSSSEQAGMLPYAGTGDDLPVMTTSQSTVSSSQSSALYDSAPAEIGRKRPYEEQMEDDLDIFFGEVEAEDMAEISASPFNRPMARMKAMSRKPVTDGGVEIVEDTDFEEAIFLTPMDVDDSLF